MGTALQQTNFPLDGPPLMVDLDMAEADQLVKDGVVSRAEFFKFYTGCSDEEAQKVFQRASFGAAA